MNKNTIVILSIVIGGGAIALFYSFIKQYTPKYVWSEQYSKTSEEPYGLSIFYNLLDKDGQDIVNIKKDFNKTLDTNKINTNYVVAGDYLYIDSLRAEHILKYVEKGNTALILSNSAPLEITRSLIYYKDTINDYSYEGDSVIAVSFNDSMVAEKYKFHYQHLKDTTNYYWMGYPKSYVNDTLSLEGFEALSTINNMVNCYGFGWGEGQVIVYTTPILFTNYNIIQEDGFKNVNQILEYLHPGETFWDEVSQRYYEENNWSGNEENPLQFLFSHYTLRWGWYLFLITIVVYLFFRTKREQRIIPILPTNPNSSIAYTKAIGTLYFQKGQHKLIANEMYLLFLSNLRTSYQINTTIKEELLIMEITKRSGIDEDTVTALFKLFRKVRYSPMANSKDLINLHNAVEFYYKNCI